MNARTFQFNSGMGRVFFPNHFTIPANAVRMGVLLSHFYDFSPISFECSSSIL